VEDRDRDPGPEGLGAQEAQAAGTQTSQAQAAQTPHVARTYRSTK
jgi:hypothetical protein